MARLTLLRVKVDLLTEDDIFDTILKLSKESRPTQVVLLDTILLMKAKFSKKTFDIINSADLIIPTSKGVRRGVAFLNKLAYRQIPSDAKVILKPTKFMIRLLSYFTEKKESVYLLGSNRKTIICTEKNVKDSFPGIKLMGCHHARYKKTFEHKLITSIYKIAPSLLVVSMSRPKQERWIHTHVNSRPNGVAIGVENFTYDMGEKLLKPTTQLKNDILRSIKSLLKKPFRFCDYFIYTLYLINYKIFGIENKVRKTKVK